VSFDGCGALVDHLRMRLIPLGDRVPHVDPSAWVADTATIVGDVTVGPDSSVFYSAVLRADMEAVSVGAGSNIQDGAVLHADPGFPARIGDDVSVGHGAVLHGCTVEEGCLVGMNATVLNGAVIGAGSLVAANALVPEGTVIPPRSLVAGVPGKVRRELTDAEVEHCRANAGVYRHLAETHRAATHS
jgi:carbonic anhydrase/acetyltransferase-like protein (isoleucine patch superfamily)